MFSLATALATLFLSKDPLVVVDSVVLLFVDEAAWFSSYIHSPKEIVITYYYFLKNFILEKTPGIFSNTSFVLVPAFVTLVSFATFLVVTTVFVIPFSIFVLEKKIRYFNVDVEKRTLNYFSHNIYLVIPSFL